MISNFSVYIHMILTLFDLWMTGGASIIVLLQSSDVAVV